MITKTKRASRPVGPRAKIRHALRGVVPAGKTFTVHIASSKLAKKQVVRIVTPAWKHLRPATRIVKVLGAVNTKLTPSEKSRILRFSVLTPDEFKTIKPRRLSRRSTVRKSG